MNVTSDDQFLSATKNGLCPVFLSLVKISFNQRQNLSGLNIILKILFKTSHVKLLCWDIMCLPPDEIIQTGQTTEVLRESIQLEIKYSIASKNLKVHSWSL